MVKLEASWHKLLKDEFEKPYFEKLKHFLLEEKKQHVVYPPGSLIFNAFELTPFPKVKVVILGQDPYHGEGQAHGLSFSVPDRVKPPPSLVNIFKEIHDDLGIQTLPSGNLTRWAEQGVLLLNANLTVRANSPASHKDKGWESFTDKVIQLLSEEKEQVVFMLWGAFARAKKSLIDRKKNLVLEAPHPSPFSAYTGFMGCRHFSQCNAYLKEHMITPINWE